MYEIWQLSCTNDTLTTFFFHKSCLHFITEPQRVQACLRVLLSQQGTNHHVILQMKKKHGHKGRFYESWSHHVSVCHYNDVIMGTIASQITSLTIVYSTIYSDADQKKHQSSTSLAFMWGIHRGPVNSPHKWPVMQKRFIWWRHYALLVTGCITLLRQA